MRAVYLTHPQVRIDPAVPVPLWGLSEIGRGRAEAFAARGVVPAGASVFSSTETKALELAEIIARVAGTRVLSDHAMGENDRSATGFLPPPLFEDHADRFFAHPAESVEGWERAVDAQARIVASVGKALTQTAPTSHVIFCGHGAVGTLLKCHLAGRAILRSEDQDRHGGPGGGNGFAFDLAEGRLIADWTPLEAIGAEWFA